MTDNMTDNMIETKIIFKPEDVVWVEIDEDGDWTGSLVDFNEDETLYEIGEVDIWDGRTYILKLISDL